MNRCKWYYTTLEDTTLPSQVPEYAWISCTPEPKEEITIGLDTLVGKWMVFCETMQEADELWKHIKVQLYQDELGISAKAATKFKPGEKGYLICIYTKDWRNTEDVIRVLATIRELGVKGTIYYKSDEMTLLRLSGSIYVSRYGTHMKVTPKGYDWYEWKCLEIPKELL